MLTSLTGIKGSRRSYGWLDSVTPGEGNDEVYWDYPLTVNK